MALGYAFPFTLSILIAFIWLGFNHPPLPARTEQPLREPVARLNMGIVALVTGLAGARLGHVLIHWPHYSRSMVETVQFWQGGLSWAGGTLGALFGIGIMAHRMRVSFWNLADRLAIPAVFLSIGAWYGCVVDACAYGRIVEPSIFAPQTLDLMGNINSRWPTANVGMLYSLFLLLGMLRLERMIQSAGVLSSVSLSLIAAGALGLSFTRGDPSRILASIRVDGLAACGILILGVFGIISRLWISWTKEKT